MTAPRDEHDESPDVCLADYEHGTTLDPVYLEYLEWVEELRDQVKPRPDAP